MRSIHGTAVQGDLIDDETRCAHYGGATDIIAIRFRCCGRWFPCFECHAAEADHLAEIWRASDFDKPAVLCGVCGYQLTIDE